MSLDKFVLVGTLNLLQRMTENESVVNVFMKVPMPFIIVPKGVDMHGSCFFAPDTHLLQLY